MAVRAFRSDEVAIGIAVALLAQLGFMAMMASETPPAARAEISDEKAKPYPVSITPMLADAPLLKKGSPNPGKVPNAWATRPKPATPNEGPRPSTQADKSPEAANSAKVTDAGPPPPEPVDASAPSTTEASDSGPAAASSVKGVAEGDPDGGETDPLRGRVRDQYKAELARWILGRFNIRGKVPFATLKTLRAFSQVSISGRRVTGFSITPSGDATFDAEVKATLSGIQSSGALLPAPPETYPDLLGSSLPVSFQCTIQSACE